MSSIICSNDGVILSLLESYLVIVLAELKRRLKVLFFLMNQPTNQPTMTDNTLVYTVGIVSMQGSADQLLLNLFLDCFISINYGIINMPSVHTRSKELYDQGLSL